MPLWLKTKSFLECRNCAQDNFIHHKYNTQISGSTISLAIKINFVPFPGSLYKYDFSFQFQYSDQSLVLDQKYFAANVNLNQLYSVLGLDQDFSFQFHYSVRSSVLDQKYFAANVNRNQFYSVLGLNQYSVTKRECTST